MMNIFKNEEGQALVEYAIILAIVAVLTVGALQALSGAVQTVFGNITGVLSTL